MIARTAALWLAAAAAAQPATAAAATAPAPLAAKASSAEAELRELKTRIEAIRARLSQAEENRAEAADALQTSERAISEANRAIIELLERSRLADSRVVDVKREIAATETGIARQRADAAKLIYSQYVAGRPDALALILSGRDPNAIARELHYLTYVGRARSHAIAELSAGLARQQGLLAEVEKIAAELASIAGEQRQQKRRLDNEKRARADVLVRLSRDIDTQRREIGALERDESRLTRLIGELARLIARTPRPKPAPAPDTRPRSEPRIANDRLPEAESEEGPFARLKGRLRLPVRGELAGRFGSPRQDGGAVWKGLFIAARAGEEIRAIAGGRVVFADWLRGFGNLLIIDHGENYLSLYGYNETLYKRVGDAIRGGERIAGVGNTGGHAESGLYFEMRYEGRPFDPMSWIARK